MWIMSTWFIMQLWQRKKTDKMIYHEKSTVFLQHWQILVLTKA